MKDEDIKPTTVKKGGRGEVIALAFFIVVIGYLIGGGVIP